MQNLGTGELFIVVAVLFVLFGGKKLPDLAKGLGEAGKEFNKAFKGDPPPPKKPNLEPTPTQPVELTTKDSPKDAVDSKMEEKVENTN